MVLRYGFALARRHSRKSNVSGGQRHCIGISTTIASTFVWPDVSPFLKGQGSPMGEDEELTVRETSQG
jgi:hypothetical protein